MTFPFRYYANLRQEMPPKTDTVYHHRIHPKGITPQEINGLQTVLNIIRTVAGMSFFQLDQKQYSRMNIFKIFFGENRWIPFGRNVFIPTFFVLLNIKMSGGRNPTVRTWVHWIQKMKMFLFRKRRCIESRHLRKSGLAGCQRFIGTSKLRRSCKLEGRAGQHFGRFGSHSGYSYPPLALHRSRTNS